MRRGLLVGRGEGRTARRSRRFLVERLEDRTVPVVIGVSDVAGLVAAVAQANGGGEAYTIELAAGTYDLESELSISHADLTIRGAGGESTILTNTRSPSRILGIEGGSVQLVGLVITGGRAEAGGGIFSQNAALTLEGVVLSNNVADFQGGAVFVTQGTLGMRNCVVAGNQATRFEGGGIFVFNASMQLDQVVLSGNRATSGGGLFVSQSSSSVIDRSTVAENQASEGAGIAASDSTILIDRTTIAANGRAYQGGGVFVSRGSAVIDRSTVSSNQADFGGGVAAVSATLRLNRTTLSCNQSDQGGGIYASSSVMVMDQCKIVGNAANLGGGLFAGGGRLTLSQSVVSGNTAAVGGGLFLGRVEAVQISQSVIHARSGGGIFNDGSVGRIKRSYVDGTFYRDEPLS